MAAHKSPLRDRLLSNSPDPIKSSILRESGMGWNSPPNTGSISSGSSGSITSPLRIAKRDSRPLPQPQLARRSSSSYKHVTNNNLVSKSPFKSQIPTPSSTPSRHTPVSFPSSRRVSGEKRPRPSSIHEQAENENERPFSLKRERKQSKGFQDLIQKEPVTKSPFKQRTPSVEERPPPTPLPVVRMSIHSYMPTDTPGLSTLAISSAPKTTVLTRSSLVSRKMLGPRLSGGRRERRKTVTFDERCDVVEFDREEDTDEDAYGSAEEDEDSYDKFYPEQEEGHQDNDPLYHNQRLDERSVPYTHEHIDDGGDYSYESIQLSDADTGVRSGPSLLDMSLDPDASITGIVDEIFFSSRPTDNTSPDTSTHDVGTPPTHNFHADTPTDMETLDGVPFGMPYNEEQSFGLHQQLQSPQVHRPQTYSSINLRSHSSSQHNFIPEESNLSTRALPQGPLATPPRLTLGSSAGTDTPQPTMVLEDTFPPSLHSTPPRSIHAMNHTTPPLGRSSHIERIRKAKDEENNIDVEMLPGTPSPCKSTRRPDKDDSLSKGGDSLIPRFEIAIGPEDVSLHQNANTSADDPFAILKPSTIEEEKSNETMDPANLSIGTSTVGLNSIEFDDGPKLSSEDPRDNSGPSSWDDDAKSDDTYSVVSMAQNSGNSETGGQPDIDREEVKRRLMARQNVEEHQVSDTSLSDDIDEENPFDEEREDRDQMSFMTTTTNFSTEIPTIERAEKRRLTGTGIAQEELGLLSPGGRLQFNFGSKFGSGGLNIEGSASSRDGLRVLNAEAGEEEAESIKSGGSIKMGEVDVDMDMRSALDRLMDDVAGTRADNSMTIDDNGPYIHEQSRASTSAHADARAMGRTTTDSTLLHNGFASRNPSGASVLSVPPPVPPKDNIRSREQLILEKRREAKRMEEDEGLGYYTPPKAFGGRSGSGQKNLGIGRPSRRRSMSTGDVHGDAKKRGDVLLDVGVGDGAADDDALGDSIDKELKKLMGDSRKSKYLVREHEGTIYASSSEPDHISHIAGPGDLNTGKAWRPVRRPSDMNEYSKQIKEYRAQDKSGKAYGKVFVKVLGIKDMHLPLPSQPTALTCTLNNGIHFVSTPECPLSRDSRIEQEFELIEHNKLEFTLTLKVRRDPHIIAQFKAIAPAPAPIPPPVAPAPSKGGMRSFFSSSPKKSSKDKLVAPPQPPPPTTTVQRLPENLARYLKPDGTLARAFISFKDIASHCDTRLFETSYPLIGQRVELGGKFSTLQVGEIVLQMFRLPPLPGISPEQLPQSLEECHRGLRHINWHKVTYFEGTLTQSGGDCSTWRRRQLRVIGANLVAFNDVTKKATATIDLKKAIAVEDDQESHKNAFSPSSRSRYADEYDGVCGVERSFRLIFPQDQEIIFFADTDEEKNRWLDVLRALVGHIPPHPLWAELLWQRQDELAKSSQSIPTSYRPVARSSSPYTAGRQQR